MALFATVLLALSWLSVPVVKSSINAAESRTFPRAEIVQKGKDHRRLSAPKSCAYRNGNQVDRRLLKLPSIQLPVANLGQEFDGKLTDLIDCESL